MSSHVQKLCLYHTLSCIANACPDICRILKESCKPCTEHISNLMQPQKYAG